LYGEGAGDSNALLLTTRELVGISPTQTGQADGIEELSHPGPPAIVPWQTEPDVRLHGEMREETPLLGDVAKLPALGGHMGVIVVHDDLTNCHGSAVGSFKAGEKA
jgi:hypothetical protein